MNREEQLLVILSEECVEVAKEVSKALRFGLDDFEPGTIKTNRQKIAAEFNDLFAVAQMLVEEGILDNSKMLCPLAITIKQEKVEKYLEISRSLGRLE